MCVFIEHLRSEASGSKTKMILMPRLTAALNSRTQLRREVVGDLLAFWLIEPGDHDEREALRDDHDSSFEMSSRSSTSRGVQIAHEVDEARLHRARPPAPTTTRER